MICAVLFDLDGTLLDSAPDLVAALNAVRQQNDLPELPLADVQNAASRGAVGLLQAGMPQADPQTLERWRLAFLASYEKNSFRQSTLFDGISDLLAYLASIAMPWGIVTNKPEYLTYPILKSAGLSNAVGCVVCGDTLEERKPHPAPVLLACEQLAVAPGNALFVGDDLRDLEAGMAAGVKTCGALYGYGSGELIRPENLELLNRGISIERPAELIDWIRKDRTSKERAAQASDQASVSTARVSPNDGS